MKIRFSIWRDQVARFASFMANKDSFQIAGAKFLPDIHIIEATGSPYRGWSDYQVIGTCDNVMKFFHFLGEESYKIHVYRDNPVTE
jgi:hypothetical protein